MSVLARLVFVSAVSGYALSFAPAEAQQRPADVSRPAPSPQRTFLDTVLRPLSQPTAEDCRPDAGQC